jgi:DNA-binding NarL/FixJ family response regulator
VEGAPGRVEVLLADHDPLARQAVREAMGDRDDVAVVGEVADIDELTAAAFRIRPQVALVGADLAPTGGVAATRELARIAPDTHVVLFAMHEDADVAIEALGAGADGYLTKDIDLRSLVRALHGAAAGEAAITRRMTTRVLERLRTMTNHVRHMRPVSGPLSNRQWQVLDLLAEGHSAAEIAELLQVSPDTVRTHTRGLQRGLRASSTEEAIQAAERLRRGT